MVKYYIKQEALAAVKESGFALSHASDELRNDKEVALKAFKQDVRALRYVGKELMSNTAFLYQLWSKKSSSKPLIDNTNVKKESINMKDNESESV